MSILRNNYARILLAVTCLLTVNSCKQILKTDPVLINPDAKLTIHFNHQVNGLNLLPDTLLYTNTAGNRYSVSLFKYYVSNIQLVKEDGSLVSLNNYTHIKAFDPLHCSGVAGAVPNGVYVSIKFLLGIDSGRNHTGTQDGDLDPANSMFWSWNTGYIFFKHEGNFIDNASSVQPLMFHLGGDRARAAVEIPIALNIAGSEKQMDLVFDLNQLYNNPIIDFNIDHFHNSTVSSDSLWIEKMKANLNDAFLFQDAQ